MSRTCVGVVVTEERLERLHTYTRDARGQHASVPPRAASPAAVLPRLLPPQADRPRARQGQGAAARRCQPPQLSRPLRDRRHAALAAAAPLRRQGRALREALAGLAPLPSGCLPDEPRAGRHRRGRNGARDPRPRRRRLHLPGGDPDSLRLAGNAEARRRTAGARDRRFGASRRGDRHRARSPRLAHPAAEGAPARRPGDDLPANRASVAVAGGDGQRADLAEHRAAMGVARRPAAAAQGGGDRRRELGHRHGGAARPRRARGPARNPHARAGRRAQGGEGEREVPPRRRASARDRRQALG